MVVLSKAQRALGLEIKKIYIVLAKYNTVLLGKLSLFFSIHCTTLNFFGILNLISLRYSISF